MAIQVPVTNGKVTQRWGKPVSSVASLEPPMWANGDRAYWAQYPGSTFFSHYHPGIDRAAVVGTPILAMESASIIFGGYRNATSGYAVEAEIRPGVRYGFNHASKVQVRAGNRVSRGQICALIGVSGVTTGPHTHYYISIKEAGTDGISRTFLYNPALFEPGGALVNDPRVTPGIVSPPSPPKPGSPVTVLFAPGTYTGVKFNSSGGIVASKKSTLTRTSSAPSSQRSMIKNQSGFWYFITAGIWAGYWIKEGSGASTLTTPVLTPAPSPTNDLVVLKGPEINIRTSPDLDVGTDNLYATSRLKGAEWALPTGIYRYKGALIHTNIFTGFALRRELTNDDGKWIECYGFGRVLYIHRDLVNITER